MNKWRGAEVHVGMIVRAISPITESNFPSSAPVGHLHTHASPNDAGVVEHIDERGTPTVRFYKSGTATTVWEHEIVLTH